MPRLTRLESTAPVAWREKPLPRRISSKPQAWSADFCSKAMILAGMVLDRRLFRLARPPAGSLEGALTPQEVGAGSQEVSGADLEHQPEQAAEEDEPSQEDEPAEDPYEYDIYQPDHLPGAGS